MYLNMGAKTRWQLKLHIFPMEEYHKFWKVNEGICKPHLSGINTKTWPHKKRLKSQQSKITLVVLVYATTHAEFFFFFFIFHLI
jgi:hypothetical protein